MRRGVAIWDLISGREMNFPCLLINGSRKFHKYNWYKTLLAQASYHTQAYVMMIKTKMASFAFVNEFLAMYNEYFVHEIYNVSVYIAAII